MVRTKAITASNKKKASSNSPSALSTGSKQSKRNSNAGGLVAPTPATGPTTRNSDKRKKSLPARKNATVTKQKTTKAPKKKASAKKAITSPVSDMSDIIADEIRKEWGIPDAMDKMDEVASKQGEAGGDVLSQNYLLAVLNKLQLQGPPPPPAPTIVPPPPGVDDVTITSFLVARIRDSTSNRCEMGTSETNVETHIL